MKNRKNSATGRQLDGKALGATLIHLAVKHREEVALKELSQDRVVVEFLVLCRFQLTLLGVGRWNRIAKSMLAGLHEEFVAFDPEYEDLFEARMERYFKATENVAGEDLLRCLVDDWACCVGVSTDVATWAFEVLVESSTVFLELISAVGRDASRTPCSRRVDK
jgi:hypothetical protein